MASCVIIDDEVASVRAPSDLALPLWRELHAAARGREAGGKEEASHEGGNRREGVKTALFI